MKVSTKWLREHLNTTLSFKEIIKNLENLGLPCEKIYSEPELWNQVEIVKIINKEKHPNADKLNIYTIKKSNNEELNIVCGDSSLEVDNYVPYVKPGCTMPSGFKIKTAKIRGIESPGMLCSANEINLPIDTSGVLKCFQEDFGKKISEAYESEGIFEVETTPNRGDALSIYGIARILANENFGTLSNINKNIITSENKTFFEVDSNDCSALYCALIEHEVQKTNYKIIKKLQITNHSVTNIDIVDLTNYISHEIGHPMHAFDYDKLKESNLTIKNLQTDQEFEALSGQKINLKKGTLVFKKDDEVISWPGVIGGENSKIDENSKNILLEAGVFKVDSMQRRSNKVITSAAKKFEYGVDPTNFKTPIEIMTSTLNAKVKYTQEKEFKDKKEINFEFNKVKEITGLDIQYEDFKSIMQKKGYIFNENNTISPPGYKFFDIKCSNCIVEEFIVNKYDEIKSINLPPKYPNNFNIKAKVSEVALSEGFNECKNLAISAKESSEFNISENNRKIANSSNLNYSYLRGSLIPGLLKNFEWHIKNNYKEETDFFEEGLVYGNYEAKQKKVFTAISNNIDKLKKVLSKIINQNKLSSEVISKQEKISYSDNSSSFFYKDKKIASLATIKKAILKDFDISECYALEIELDNINIASNKNTLSNQLPIYKDITITLPENKPSSEITNILKEKGYIFQVKSIYPSNNLNEKRNLTLEFKFQENKPLTKEEVKVKIEKIEKLINNL